jgi:hypothetical protein
MPNWAIHILVSLLALLIVGRKEDQKYILLLLPFAVLSDIDTFATEHRALLHNVFIPLVLALMGISLIKMRTIFFITAFYFASHIILDLFGGGVVLFYPFYNEMAFIDASLEMSKTNELLWTFDYGFSGYVDGWKLAEGYVSDSIGTGSLALVFVAGVWAARYRLLAGRNK